MVNKDLSLTRLRDPSEREKARMRGFARFKSLYLNFLWFFQLTDVLHWNSQNPKRRSEQEGIVGDEVKHLKPSNLKGHFSRQQATFHAISLRECFFPAISLELVISQPPEAGRSTMKTRQALQRRLFIWRCQKKRGETSMRKQRVPEKDSRAS